MPDLRVQLANIASRWGLPGMCGAGGGFAACGIFAGGESTMAQEDRHRRSNRLLVADGDYFVWYESLRVSFRRNLPRAIFLDSGCDPLCRILDGHGAEPGGADRRT